MRIQARRPLDYDWQILTCYTRGKSPARKNAVIRIVAIPRGAFTPSRFSLVRDTWCASLVRAEAISGTLSALIWRFELAYSICCRNDTSSGSAHMGRG